jgi:hypothetical protein
MKRNTWQLYLGILLIVLSALVYYFHFLIFRDPHHIFIYLIGDIAFVFIEVLMVTLVIHTLLNIREKRERLEKLNMLIGVFFSEVGTRLLVIFSDSDPDLVKIKKDLIIEVDWTEKTFENIDTKLRNYKYDVEIKKIDLVNLRDFLLKKSDFLVRLLENPNLLEHETFTELLRAVFHLDEELRSRKNVNKLTVKDSDHISGDIKRSYSLLVDEWLDYMHHLKNNYPYLFSLAIRLNPFDEKATPELK